MVFGSLVNFVSCSKVVRHFRGGAGDMYEILSGKYIP